METKFVKFGYQFTVNDSGEHVNGPNACSGVERGKVIIALEQFHPTQPLSPMSPVPQPSPPSVLMSLALQPGEARMLASMLMTAAQGAR